MADYTDEINNLLNFHGQPMADDDSPIMINASTKNIEIQSDFSKVIALEYETNSNIITFECDKYIEGHDISQCSYPFIKWEHQGNEIKGDVYRIPEVQKIENDKVQFIWLIGPELTSCGTGKINFQIGFMDYTVKSEGEDYVVDKVTFKWTTNPCVGKFEIGPSIFSSKIDDFDSGTIIAPFPSMTEDDLKTVLKEVYGL